jgi:flagellin
VSITAASNIPALLGINAFNRASQQMFTSMERLSTGKKINRASDDPAGMQAAEQMKARLATINSRIDTIDYQDHYLGARDGAQSVVSDQILKLQSDVTQAANTSGLTASEKQALQDDASSILKTIDFLSQTSTYDNQQILTGDTTSNLGSGVAARPTAPPQTDPNTGLPIPAPTSYYSLHDLSEGGDLNLVTGDLDAAQKVITQAAATINGDRAAIGTQINTLGSERRGLMSELENTEAARSQIEDTDYAEETSKLVRAQILQEVSVYVTQVAEHQQTNTVLKLLGE